MWVYGHTDLTDFYRDRLTLRQVMVRLLALPATPPNRAPIWDLLEDMDTQAAARRQVADIEGALARFKPKEG